MPFPIAMIPYANMAPYRQAGCPAGCRFVPLVPSASVSALREGRVLAAAVPVAVLPALGDRVRPIGRFGIAAKEECMSVLLFSNRPLSSMEDVRNLRVTAESTTSVRLLGLLLGRPEGLPRPANDTGSRPAGELIIGDKALSGLHHWRQGLAGNETAKRLLAYSHVTDLASEWYARTRVPFVFARWVIRSDAPEACRSALGRWLDRFRRREAEFVDAAAATASTETRLPEPLMRQYFDRIRRTLDADDMDGQTLFVESIESGSSILGTRAAVIPAATAA